MRSNKKRMGGKRGKKLRKNVGKKGDTVEIFFEATIQDDKPLGKKLKGIGAHEMDQVVPSRLQRGQLPCRQTKI